MTETWYDEVPYMSESDKDWYVSYMRGVWMYIRTPPKPLFPLAERRAQAVKAKTRAARTIKQRWHRYRDPNPVEIGRYAAHGEPPFYRSRDIAVKRVIEAKRIAREEIDGLEQVPHRSNKNTKRWCRGKVGRKHVEVRDRPERWNLTICKNCGKHLAYESLFRFEGRQIVKREDPERVPIGDTVRCYRPEFACRAKEVNNALATVRLSGGVLSPTLLDLYSAYVNGSVTWEHCSREIDDWFESMYGPPRKPSTISEQSIHGYGASLLIVDDPGEPYSGMSTILVEVER